MLNPKDEFRAISSEMYLGYVNPHTKLSLTTESSRIKSRAILCPNRLGMRLDTQRELRWRSMNRALRVGDLSPNR